MQSPDGKIGLTGTQKTGFVLLCVFGLLAVSLGFLQMRNTIYGPFAIKITVNPNASLPADEDTRLQMIDTDHDGFNDWEEINFYETSPYLPDTDSDGINDKQEVDAGTDPLCPKGEKCAESDILVDATKVTSTNTGIGTLDIVATENNNSTNLSNSGDNVMQILANAGQLRSILAESGGISQEDLAKIDDASLLKLVDEVLQGKPELLAQLNSLNTATSSVVGQ